MGFCYTEDEPHHKDRLSISKIQEESKICDIENSNFYEKQKNQVLFIIIIILKSHLIQKKQ